MPMRHSDSEILRRNEVGGAPLLETRAFAITSAPGARASRSTISPFITEQLTHRPRKTPGRGASPTAARSRALRQRGYGDVGPIVERPGNVGMAPVQWSSTP